VTIDIHNPTIAQHFKEIDASHWQNIETGKIIQYALLTSYTGYGNSGLCGWQFLGKPRSNEIPIGPNKVKQYYDLGVMCYDNGKVYPLPLYEGDGLDPAIPVLETQLAELKAQSGNSDALAAIKQGTGHFCTVQIGSGTYGRTRTCDLAR